MSMRVRFLFHNGLSNGRIYSKCLRHGKTVWRRSPIAVSTVTTRAAAFSQADVTRASRGALKAGLPVRRVEIDAAGKSVVICSEDAEFFDPHVTYGRTAAVEPIGLSRRVPLGEALRITLMGIDERVTARRAYEIGLVSEIVDRSELWSRAEAIAGCIASKPPLAIQGSVKAIWSTSGYPMFDAMKIGYSYTQIGNPTGVTSDAAAPRKAGEWTAR